MENYKKIRFYAHFFGYELSRFGFQVFHRVGGGGGRLLRMTKNLKCGGNINEPMAQGFAVKYEKFNSETETERHKQLFSCQFSFFRICFMFVQDIQKIQVG